MKKIACLFAIIFFTSAVFTAAPAKAEDYFWAGEYNTGTPAPNNTPAPNSNSTSNSGEDHKKGDGGGGTALPINGGVVLLMIAGLAIGVTTLNKTKSLKLAPARA